VVAVVVATADAADAAANAEVGDGPPAVAGTADATGAVVDAVGGAVSGAVVGGAGALVEREVAMVGAAAAGVLPSVAIGVVMGVTAAAAVLEALGVSSAVDGGVFGVFSTVASNALLTCGTGCFCFKLSVTEVVCATCAVPVGACAGLGRGGVGATVVTVAVVSVESGGLGVSAEGLTCRLTAVDVVRAGGGGVAVAAVMGGVGVLAHHQLRPTACRASTSSVSPTSHRR
jgi:hypothetical protein